MKRRVYWFVFFLVMAQAALAQTVAEKAKPIDALMTLSNRYGLFDGAVLVADQGQVIYEKGFGLANEEWKVANTPTTRFRLGSVTKQFTSMLVMQLVAEGKLKLDGKLSDYLPYYRKDTGGKITIHHLLTHTSGIPNFTDRPEIWSEHGLHPWKVEDFIKRFCSDDLQFEPGSKHRYSNSGYFVLGAVLETITGKPYEQLVRERIFQPLGMKDSGYDHFEEVITNRASGYTTTLAGTYQNAMYFDTSTPYAAGALYSTVEDLYKWDRALYSNKLLPAQYEEMMFKPFLGDYGYGWYVRKAAAGQPGQGETVIMHSGGIPGFTSLIVRMPAQRRLLVLLSNHSNPNLIGLGLQIRKVLWGQKYDEPKRSVAREITPVLLNQGAEAAAAKFRELRQRPQEYDVAEGEMNQLGYGCLRAGKIPEAIAIFKLNVEAFPKSSNVFDSLGEAYMRAGQKALAIENYEKSLQLDPTNKNGEEMLKKLKAGS